ncbi:MAG TPA: hypothetical protein VME86_01385 [Acidobacteriaceae bacterium]|nr:hypothetical protein [Acidobacteriaceae bacterium]
MAYAISQLEEIHARLSRALEDPRSVGITNGMMPQPLAELLCSALAALGQLLADMRDENSGNSLESELSQDADHR